MKQVEYTTNDGKKYAVLVPDDARPSAYKSGIIIGPPVFELDYLPSVLQVEIHNQLYNRGFFVLTDMEGRRAEINNAVLAALKHNIVDDILEAYRKVAKRD